MSRADVVFQTAPTPAANARAAAASPGGDGKSHDLFGKDGMTFSDVLGIINPLQHIPVVATVYRQLTGDSITPGARIIGDGLYGGPIGLVAGSIDAMVEDTSGRDIGGNLVAFAFGDDTAPAGKTAGTELAASGAGGAKLIAAAATPEDAKLSVAPATKLANPAGSAPWVGPAHGPWTGPTTVAVARPDGSTIDMPWWEAAHADDNRHFRTTPGDASAAYSSTLLARAPTAPVALVAAAPDAMAAPASEAAVAAPVPVTTLPTTSAQAAATPAVQTVAPGLIQPRAGVQLPLPPTGQPLGIQAAAGQQPNDANQSRVPQVAFPSNATGLSTTAGLPSSGSITTPTALMALESNVKQGQAAAIQQPPADAGAPVGPNGLKPLPQRNNFAGLRVPLARNPYATGVAHGPALPRVDAVSSPTAQPLINASAASPAEPIPAESAAVARPPVAQPAVARAVPDAAPTAPTPVAPTVASAEVSTAMLQALDKYEAMMKARAKTASTTQ